MDKGETPQIFFFILSETNLWSLAIRLKNNLLGNLSKLYLADNTSACS